MNATVRRSFVLKIRSVVSNRLAELICAGVLLLMAINLFVVISRKSLTNDEKYHIPAGYYHLVFGNFQLNPEHPPVAKMIAALPLVFIHPVAPDAVVNPEETPITQGHDAFGAFWDANPDKLQAISFWARVPMIALTLLLGVLIFVYTRQLAGTRAAALSVTMFSLEPTILAHGRIVQTDMPAAFAYLLFFFALQRFSDQQTLRRAIEVGLAAGLGLVMKFSLLVIVPIFAVALPVIAGRRFRKDRKYSIALKVAAALIASLLVINLAYYFEREPLLETEKISVIMESPPHIAAKYEMIDVLAKILPSNYLYGIFVVSVHNQHGHQSSLLGSYSGMGWWYYFPVAFALKTTLPFLFLSVVSLLWAVGVSIGRHDKRWLLPLIAIALYVGVAMTGHINIGVRHLLPVFSFLLILSGAFLDWLLNHFKRATTAVVLVLMSLMAVEAVRVFPDYIPYMNQLAWRHPHWYYLSDSNVEWGDDTGEMAQYLIDQGETKVRAALLGGWLSKAEYGLDYVNPFVVDEPVEQTRYIAIGASYLNGSTVPLVRDKEGRPITEEQRRDFFAAYRERQPEAVFGNSIYLFREGN